MKITIYTGYDTFTKRGNVTILYDRIAHINLYLPTGFYYATRPENIAAEWEAERNGTTLQTHHIYNMETAYKFQLKKLSKADIPYRKHKITHQLLSKELSEYVSTSYLYAKLKWWEVIVLTYNLRRFVWQTKEFKKHIYYYIGTGLISFIGGIIVGWKFLSQQNDQEGKNSTQPEVNSEKKVSQEDNNKPSVYPESTYQYQTLLDSAKTPKDTSTNPN